MAVASIKEALAAAVEAVDTTDFRHGQLGTGFRRISTEGDDPQVAHLTFLLEHVETLHENRRRGTSRCTTRFALLLFFSVRPVLGGSRSADEDTAATAAEAVVRAVTIDTTDDEDGWSSTVDRWAWMGTDGARFGLYEINITVVHPFTI